MQQPMHIEISDVSEIRISKILKTAISKTKCRVLKVKSDDGHDISIYMRSDKSKYLHLKTDK